MAYAHEIASVSLRIKYCFNYLDFLNGKRKRKATDASPEAGPSSKYVKIDEEHDDDPTDDEVIIHERVGCPKRRSSIN